MDKLQIIIEKEVEELHNIFVSWFTANQEQKDLENQLFKRFSEDTLFITTKGESVSYNSLIEMFKNGYGKIKPFFKIEITEVKILQDIGAYVLISYIEWQTTDVNYKTNKESTKRKTSALLSKQAPFKWLHVHETMLEK